MTDPRAATSATAEPEISAKNKDTPIFTMPNPPRTKPINAATKLIRRSVIPPAFMMAPANTNIGIAINENLVDPSYISSATVTRESVPSVITRPKIAATASETAIGTLININNSRTRKTPRTNISASPPYQRWYSQRHSRQPPFPRQFPLRCQRVLPTPR